ncbi:protein takeout-like [Anoplophora glabripennis]|uniref:protein takeout-like n=1 Tax=Anoplophora glabripennis TaxID=217634 RepID=UPI0008747EC0|nr:protein takeout-like [Anoplophora glabripennis]
MVNKTEIFTTVVVLLTCVCFSDNKKPRASYIKPCSKSAPDFDECCVAHGKDALPHMLKGDKEYNIPNLTPFVVPLVSLSSANLKIGIRDMHLHGLETNELKQVKFDFDNKKVTVKIFFNVINIIGDFEMDGKILMIPLQGSGKSNITAVGVDVVYSLDYKLETKEGDEYFSIVSATSDFTSEKLYIDINDLLGGNKELGDTINKALNENWRALMESVKPVIAETIVKIGNSIIDGFSSTVPFADIFLD